MFSQILHHAFAARSTSPKAATSFGSTPRWEVLNISELWSWVSWVVLVEFRTWRLWEICFQSQKQLRCQFLQRMELNQFEWVSTRTVSNYSDRLYVDFSVKSQLVLKWIDVASPFASLVLSLDVWCVPAELQGQVQGEDDRSQQGDPIGNFGISGFGNAWITDNHRMINLREAVKQWPSTRTSSKTICAYVSAKS